MTGGCLSGEILRVLLSLGLFSSHFIVFFSFDNFLFLYQENKASLLTHSDLRQKLGQSGQHCSLLLFSKGIYNCVERYTLYERVVNKLSKNIFFSKNKL